MVKTNLLKAWALALLEAHLSARINDVLVSSELWYGRSRKRSRSRSRSRNRRWIWRGSNNSRRVWHCLAPAHMRLMNSEAATSYNNVAQDKMRQFQQQKKNKMKLNWTELNWTELRKSNEIRRTWARQAKICANHKIFVGPKMKALKSGSWIWMYVCVCVWSEEEVEAEIESRIRT